MQRAYRFNEVAIVQKKNICKSRSDVKIESEIARGITIPIPLIAANMASITNAKFCSQLYQLGALGILHRALGEEEYLKEIKILANNCPVVAASVGINDYHLLSKLIQAGTNLIVVDIAHAYCDATIDLCKYIRHFYPHVKIIAGNTININMLDEIEGWADGLKIGCGNGSCCETATTAGCYEPQFSAVLKFRERANKLGMPIISDGSIKRPADFVKAIGAGASAVMAGQIFARCPESAAPVVDIDGVRKKIYSGMSSRDIQEKWRGKVHNDCPEGKTIFLDMGESVEKLLKRYAGALRSGISYGGCNNIVDFKENCEFILI